MQKFLNTLSEFTGEKEDKDNFIQTALKVCKVFKVKPLKTPKPDAPSKKTAYNLFCKDIQKTKKELQGVPVSKTSAIISKEWKKVKASEKKNFTKKRNNDIKRHCRYIKKIIQMKQRLLTSTKDVTRRFHSPRKAPSKSNEPKKVPKSPEFIDDPSVEEQKSKEADGKKTKAGKKVRKTSQSKKAPNLPEFIDSSREEEEEEPPKDYKGL